MNTQFLEMDLSQLDQPTLAKIASTAEQAKNALLMGIVTIRHLNETTYPTDLHSQQMLDHLAHLTLMWDELQYRATKILAHNPDPTETNIWQEFKKPPPVTLH